LSSIPAPAIAHSPTVRDDIGSRVETGHMQATEIASAAAGVIARAWHRRGVQLDLLLQRSEDAQAQLSSEQQAVGIMQATSRVLRRAWQRRGDQVDVLEQRVAQLQMQLEQADNARLRAETASDAAGNRINILEAQLESASRLLTSRETQILSLTLKVGRLERESTKAERLLAAMQTQIKILTLVHQHLRRHLQRFRALAADTLLASVADVETAQRETEEARHRAEARQTQVDVLCAAVECLRKHLQRFRELAADCQRQSGDGDVDELLRMMALCDDKEDDNLRISTALIDLQNALVNGAPGDRAIDPSSQNQAIHSAIDMLVACSCFTRPAVAPGYDGNGTG